MSVHRFVLEAEVDDAALAEWLAGPNAKARPPYGGPDTWDASDLGACADLELVDLGESELTYEGKVSA